MIVYFSLKFQELPLVILKDHNRRTHRTWLKISSKNFNIISFLCEIWIEISVYTTVV